MRIFLIKLKPHWGKLTLLLVIVTTVLVINPLVYAANQGEQKSEIIISGSLVDTQEQPIVGAKIYISHNTQSAEQGDEAESQADGSWNLPIQEIPDGPLEITISRPHFQEQIILLSGEELDFLAANGFFRIPPITLEREIQAGFWAASVIFVLVLLLIAFEVLHSTSAALAGMSGVFLVSFIGGTINPGLFIFDFERALTFINWEVIFLVMGMMIIIAIIEDTGIFQWTTFQAYRFSRGRSWLLVLILMGITALASALLDNFTTMLLMTPISLQIGLALGINPLALIIPEVLASNVGGISTLIGTPTNILIGSYADISFNDFLVNQTIGVLLSLAVMAGYVLFHYRAEWRKQSGGISPKLYKILQERGKIKDPQTLWKSGVVFGLVILGFATGERYHIDPAVTALVGATVLLTWLKPNVPSMIKAVDWTTMVFFMALFIVVGAIQEVGLISMIAEGIKQMVGENLSLAVLAIVIGIGTLSTGIANIPLAASMLPVVEFLSGSIPGAGSKVLFYALSMGAAMGGNGLLIGGEANLVTAGITEQAGTPISFKEFLRVGLPVTYLTLVTGTLWLLFRFVVLSQ